MLRWVKHLRSRCFPTAAEEVEEVFHVREPDTSCILAGERDLGSFFCPQGLGFNEDTWPFIIVGQFYWDYDAARRREFSWSSWQRRIVVNCDARWEAYQGRLYRRQKTVFPTVRLIEDLVVRAGLDEGSCLEVETAHGTYGCHHIYINASMALLGVVAARINYLWGHGRQGSRLSSFTDGQSGDCVWHNPDEAVREDLEALGRPGTREGRSS
jgi:hypothetical protein